MRVPKVLCVLAVALATIACGSGGAPSAPATTIGVPTQPPATIEVPTQAPATTGGFVQPPGTVAVSFIADDTVNQVYLDGDLEWKGSMAFDTVTRIATADPAWAGPWAVLHDDGPWDQGAPAGHEPIGSTANDHRWGVTVFVVPPASGSALYEYGLIDRTYEAAFGNGWIWVGANGSFTINAGAATPVTAQGIAFQAFGSIDLRITVDTKKLAGCPSACPDTSTIRLKSSAWAWGLQAMTVGDVATFTLSDVVGSGRPLAHSGLLKPGDKPEFVLVFGPGDGVEYRDADGNAATAGIAAALKPSGASFTDQAILVYSKPSGNGNTYIEVP